MSSCDWKSSTIYHYYVTILPVYEVGLHFILDDLLILWMGCCLFTTHKNSQKLKYSINTCSFNCLCALLMHFNCTEKEKVQCPTLNCYIPGSTNNCSVDRALDTGRSLIGAVQYLTLLHEIHKQHCYQPLNQESKLLLTNQVFRNLVYSLFIRVDITILGFLFAAVSDLWWRLISDVEYCILNNNNMGNINRVKIVASG